MLNADWIAVVNSAATSSANLRSNRFTNSFSMSLYLTIKSVLYIL